MGRHGFRVVYDHDGGRQRRMQREQGRTQSADSSSTGSTVLQLRQRRTDGGGISAAGYVCAAFEWTLAAATPNGRSLAEVIPLSSKVRAEKLT